MLHSAAQVAAAADAPSRVLIAAEQATAYPTTAPRGRLEQSLIDLGVRDAGLLRQGAGLDQMAQRVLAHAYRAGLASPQPDAQAPPDQVPSLTPQVSNPAQTWPEFTPASTRSMRRKNVRGRGTLPQPRRPARRPSRSR